MSHPVLICFDEYKNISASVRNDVPARHVILNNHMICVACNDLSPVQHQAIT